MQMFFSDVSYTRQELDAPDLRRRADVGRRWLHPDVDRRAPIYRRHARDALRRFLSESSHSSVHRRRRDRPGRRHQVHIHPEVRKCSH